MKRNLLITAVLLALLPRVAQAQWTFDIVSVEAYINPIPAGLVLTGIVVSVSVSALMLALCIRLYYRYNTLNLDEIITLAGKEEV